MKIEAGKRYMDTTGAVTTAMHNLIDTDTGANIFFSCSVNGEIRCYTDEGKYLTEGSHKYNLVAEYKERKIVGWTEEDYGRKYPVYADADEDDAGADRVPLLNIFKPIRNKILNIPAEFLVRLDDGSYIFSLGNPYEVVRVDANDVDDQFENVPDPEPTKALIYLCQNVVTGDKYIRSIKPVEDKLLETCEIVHSDEDGWQVRDLKCS